MTAYKWNQCWVSLSSNIKESLFNPHLVNVGKLIHTLSFYWCSYMMLVPLQSVCGVKSCPNKQNTKWDTKRYHQQHNFVIKLAASQPRKPLEIFPFHEYDVMISVCESMLEHNQYVNWRLSTLDGSVYSWW